MPQAEAGTGAVERIGPDDETHRIVQRRHRIVEQSAGHAFLAAQLQQIQRMPESETTQAHAARLQFDDVGIVTPVARQVTRIEAGCGGFRVLGRWHGGPYRAMRDACR